MVLVVLGGIFLSSKVCLADTFETRVTKVIEDKTIEIDGVKQPDQKLELTITRGDLKDRKIIVENGNIPVANVVRYKLNDRLMVNRQKDPTGRDVFNIVDFIRTDTIYLLLIIFIAATILIAQLKGVLSLLSVGVTFGIIFWIILPQLSAGTNPVVVAIIGSILIIPITFYLSHGLNKKTSVAIGGTLISLIVTGILASLFINIGKLNGFSSEEAGLLATIKQGAINMKGLLLAGIVIGAVGVLDDITISQAAIVEQLSQANEKLKFRELYNRAMKIGRDHITSMVNTLILVYAGASLPLLLIFIDNPHPISEIINLEFIAEEITRTLVGSIGLILAVPITTLIACVVFKKLKIHKRS